MGAEGKSMKHFAHTTSVQNLDPEIVLKFISSSDIEKSLMWHQKKIEKVILEQFLPTYYFNFSVDLNT